MVSSWVDIPRERAMVHMPQPVALSIDSSSSHRYMMTVQDLAGKVLAAWGIPPEYLYEKIKTESDPERFYNQLYGMFAPEPRYQDRFNR